jgi:hypothetical protein
VHPVSDRGLCDQRHRVLITLRFTKGNFKKMTPHTFRRFATGTAALGTAVLCGMAPAHAALTSPVANAYVVSANVAGLVVVPPTVTSAYPPGGTNSLANLNLGPISATVLQAATSGNPSTGTSSAGSSVAGVGVNLGGLAKLNAGAVQATCTATPNGATGSASIANLSATVGLLSTALNVPVNPAPNTTVAIPGIASITLNEQSTDANGVLTVNAIHVTGLNGLLANVVIGHAQCGGAPATQPVPMINPGVAAGSAALAGVGGVVVLRRRKAAKAATTAAV